MIQLIRRESGAKQVIDESTVWGLKIITQALGVAVRNAPSKKDWELFESIRLRPFAVGAQRQSLRDVAVQLGYHNVDDANAAIVRERRRWLACLYEQLVFEFQFEYGQKADPQQVYQRMQALTQIAQQIVESDNSMTEELLRCIHSLQPRFSGEGPKVSQSGMATLSGPIETIAQSPPSNGNPEGNGSSQAARTSYQEGYERDQAFFRQIGLEHWERFLSDRLKTSPEDRVIYDARALFLLTERDAEQGQTGVAGAKQADSPTSSFRATELADELQRILTCRYSSSGVVSESPTSGPAGSAGPTILEILESPNPHGVTLGHLKEISKNQGPSDAEPWDILTSKVIYFTAIAAFIIRISPDPSQITSLPHRNLCQAFAWAVSLPWIDIRLRNIIVQAWQRIDT